MLTAVLTWLGTSGASLILGFIGGVIKDMVADSRNRQALEDKARAETQLEQARATQAATEAQLDAAINTAPRSSSDAIERLKKGTA